MTVQEVCEKYGFHFYSPKTRKWEYELLSRWMQDHVAHGAKILDVGSGESGWPLFLALNGYDVTALDTVTPEDPPVNGQHYISPKSLTLKAAELTHRRAHELQLPIRYLIMDLLRLDEKFDVVTAVSAFEHFSRDMDRLTAYAKKLISVSNRMFITTDIVKQGPVDIRGGSGWEFTIDTVRYLFDRPPARMIRDEEKVFTHGVKLLAFEVDNEGRDTADI